MATCRDCNGSGKIKYWQGDPKTGERIEWNETCRRCGGSGTE